MALLTKDEARQILEKILSYSKAEECEANLNGNVSGNIRYARNTVTTSGAQNDATLVVQSSYGKKTGTATINEFDDASLEKAVRRSEELAKLAPENPEYVNFLEPQRYLDSKAYFESTAAITPEYRTQVAANSIKPSRAKNLTAAGFMQNNVAFQAMINSKGLSAYHQETGVNFSVTVRTNDGTGSGYVTRDHNDVTKLDTAAASQIAIEKAELSKNPVAIEPGKYTVILEPAASIELLQNMIFNMDARQTDEGRTFLAKAGGGTRVGEKLMDERVTIYSDPTHAEVPTATWGGDGRPQERIVWIEKGVVKNLFYSRYWAQKKGVKAIPPPSNGVMEGGNATVEEMVRATKKGILVSRTWYIRTVDPQTLLYTGLTRDGLFYIENGKIKHAVKNFRFNESPVIMLNNLEALGQPQRINGNLVPPMMIRDFTFTSLSDAV
jgi:predicted Zn-dependent protease